jgi:hypothetical protein
MSTRELREGLNRFKSIEEAPQLARINTEQQEKLVEKDREKEEMEQDHAREVARLHRIINRNQFELAREQEKNKELDSIKIEYGKEKITLRELKKHAKKQVKLEMEDQVKSQAEKLALKKLPEMVKAEIKRYPDKCHQETGEIIRNQALQQRDKYLADENSWSPWFQQHTKNHIHKRVEQEKNHAFWEQVYNRFDYEIEQALPTYWNSYLHHYATKFTRLTIQDQLRKLATPLMLYCPKCNGPHQYTFTPNEMATLIKTGLFSFPCSYCTGWFKPRVSITLGELLWLIYNGDIKPLKRPVYRVEYKVLTGKAKKNSEDEG